MTRGRVAAAIGVAALCVSVSLGMAGPPQYQAVDLGPTPFSSDGAYGINDLGQVVGHRAARAYRWEAGAFTWNAPYFSNARDINNQGQIAGCLGIRAVIWNSGVHTSLVPGQVWGRAFAINDSGSVAGYYATEGSSHSGAFIWENGVLTNLVNPSGQSSCAYGINAHGHVVGNALSTAGSRLGFIWKDGVMEYLPVLPDYDERSYARDINDKGQVVAYAAKSINSRAYVWQDGVVTELPHLPGGFTSAPYAISNRGQVVGYSTIHGSYKQAALWEDGVVYNLNSLVPPNSGWVLPYANDINEAGWIVGTGLYDGAEHAFLLIPQPVEVALDIKPGSWLNPLSPVSKGLLPAAVCGTDEFDVMTIDAETLLLGREGIDGVAPLRWSYEDVAAPFEGEWSDGHGRYGDGFMDLALKFRTQELVSALGLDLLTGQAVSLVLTGSLLDGTPLTGSDFVWVLSPGDGNMDGLVDGLDYIGWSNHYGTGQAWSEGEFNGDGVVDGLDYILWSNNYFAGCPGQVPEPACAVLLVLGVWAVRRRRYSSWKGAER